MSQPDDQGGGTRSAIVQLLSVLGVGFGLLAAVMAFVISWDEYRRHPLSRRRLIVEAGGTALIAFVTCALLSLIAGLLLAS
jgi:hypothetical protein